MIATTHDWAPLPARRVRVHDSGGAIAAILSQANATDIITLSGGAPAAKTFPDEVPSKLTDKVLSSGSATALQYSPTQGLPSVRDAIAAPAGRDGGAVADARYPDPTFFATTVNRAACLNFSKALAIELGPENILVDSVDIGFVFTPQWENIRKRRSPEDLRGRVLHPMASEEVSLERFGGADEVSGDEVLGIVAFLASDRASYLTGTSIDVAGALGKYV